VAEFLLHLDPGTGQFGVQSRETLTVQQLQEIRLPLRHGGWGLPPAAQVSPTAYLGSVYACRAALQQFLAFGGHHLISDDTSVIRNGVLKARAILRMFSIADVPQVLVKLPTGDFPPNATLRDLIGYPTIVDEKTNEDLTELVSVKMQTILSRRVALGLMNDLTNSFANDAVALARFRSNMAPRANTLFTIVPVSSALSIPDEAFVWQLRHKIGLHPSGNVSAMAARGNGSCHHPSCNLPVDDPSHYQYCKATGKNTYNYRHRVIADIAMSELCAAAGVVVEKEVLVDRANDGKRMDVLVSAIDMCHTRRIASDISIACPTSSSYRSAASKRPLATANSRSLAKVSKYADSPLNAVHYPLVLETFGGFSDSAVKFINSIIDAAPLNLFVDGVSFRYWCYQRLTCALVDGNAYVSRYAVQGAQRGRS